LVIAVSGLICAGWLLDEVQVRTTWNGSKVFCYNCAIYLFFVICRYFSSDPSSLEQLLYSPHGHTDFISFFSVLSLLLSLVTSHVMPIFFVALASFPRDFRAHYFDTHPAQPQRKPGNEPCQSPLHRRKLFIFDLFLRDSSCSFWDRFHQHCS
jgi:hypothetical protein